MVDVDALVERSMRPLPDEGLEALHWRVHGSPGHPYVRFLYWLALELEPPLSLELGTEWGVTSEHLCAAAERFGGTVAGVDQVVEQRVHRANYRFFHALSLDAFPAIKAIGLPLGLVFQDTRMATQRAEWDLYSTLMPPGAVWVADDVEGNANWDSFPLAEKREVRGLHGEVVMGVGW